MLKLRYSVNLNAMFPIQIGILNKYIQGYKF